MSLRRIERSQWSGFCEVMSLELLGKRAAIEVASRELGLQTEALSLPVMGFNYDLHNDVLAIALEGLDHVIRHPRELYADFGSCGIESLAIVASDGWEIVLLRDPPMLPAPIA